MSQCHVIHVKSWSVLDKRLIDVAHRLFFFSFPSPSPFADPLMADPIGAAQASLVAYTKLVADTLWEVQQQRGYSASRSSAMGASLVAAGEELERLVAAVPDYAAIVGPRECVWRVESPLLSTSRTTTFSTSVPR